MRVLVTGNGLLATAIKSVSDYLFVDKKIDLTHRKKCSILMEAYKPDVVIHTAAKVGGVSLNMKHQEEMFYENMVMNANVIRAAVEYGVKKIIAFGSTCTYDERLENMVEEDIQVGEPYFKNFGYGYAKRMTEVHLRAAKDQYGVKYNYFIPSSLYGINDNFNLENGHVIPSLIHKCYLAKKNKESLKVWGDGSPRREVMFAEDLAKMIVRAVDDDMWVETILVSSGQEVSIREMVQCIVKKMGFEGKIEWQNDKPVGQSKRPLVCVDKMNKVYKNNAFTQFEKGIEKTVNWFVDNYKTIRC